MREENLKKQIYRSALFLAGLFIILILYITYLQTVHSAYLANHPLNMRANALTREVKRGDIYDQNDKQVAYSVKDDQGEYARKYPYRQAFAHIVGYSGDKIGKTGIESYCNDALSGADRPLGRLGAIGRIFLPKQGDHVKLTIDSRIQVSADEALGDRKGAIVALDAKTGAVLAMVGKPGFDPNQAEQDWELLRKDENAPLLNRATQGLYPPGSSLKPLIEDAALREGAASERDEFDCEGALRLDDQYTLYESGRAAHGKVNLSEALAASCNIVFGQLALKLGSERLQEAFERFGFLKTPDNELQSAASRLPDFRALGDGDLCQIGIGQSSLLVTPLHMAMMAGAFANDGVIMKPYVIDAIISPDGDIIKKSAPEAWLSATDAKNAGLVLSDMRGVVENGTGAGAAVGGAVVAGKTGTAENPGGSPHAWFVGCAAIGQRRIAFAVIVENGGGGALVAAPTARKVLLDIVKQGGD